MTSIILFTIIQRPYVLGFLGGYLLLATLCSSKRFAIIFLAVGYLLAFLSEWASINYGFPYGWYFYKYQNLEGEWLNQGVPVWDSASYVFMCFTSLYFAKLFQNQKNKPAVLTISLSAFLTLLLDIVIDPVAHLGKDWFLGDIYYYPNPGPYFDVTVQNFMGWYFVSFIINSCGLMLLNRCGFKSSKNATGIALAIYFSILFLGWGVALYLQKFSLVICSSLVIFVAYKIIRRTLIPIPT